MILPDVNLLLYAHNTLAPQHQAACDWWDTCLAGPVGVGLPWLVILGFVRLSTHPRVFVTPFSPGEALERVEEWLTLPHVSIIHPSSSHLVRFTELVSQTGTAGNLTTDTHLAALAMERGMVLHTTDADFSRFHGLKWRNPLKI